MDPKSKKVLAEQGSSVAQAVKWIGGAIFGDGDDVLDDIAERNDEPSSERPPKPLPRRAREPRRVVAQRRPPKLPPCRDYIDVEGFVDDEDDE
jgi:hypothetical protein